MVQHPLIAIPAYPSLRGSQVIEACQAYVDAITLAGGTPVLLPPTQDEIVARRMWELSDGLLLIGGGDLAAATYGASDGGKLTYVSPERDRLELQYARWSLQAGRPILGICRGIQTLNVAAGGTLIQDIPSEVAGAVNHAVSYQNGEGYTHTVQVESASLLAKALACSGGVVSINSHHHQAVNRLADGFVVSATAPDGVIEAIEKPDTRFILGVQWHPEGLTPGDGPARELFLSFVAACRKGK
ncbi:MAG: gamma-glutamyl-gamma-aminobutyrate hydrolase family protein [Anaerolineae bacterium]